MIWKIWKYALGSFADDKTRDYDNVVAIVRTIILLTYFITNIFIILVVAYVSYILIRYNPH